MKNVEKSDCQERVEALVVEAGAGTPDEIGPEASRESADARPRTQFRFRLTGLHIQNNDRPKE